MALVQSKQGQATASPVSITLDSPTTAGHGLAVLIGTSGSSATATVSGVTLGGAAGNFAQAASAGTTSDVGILYCWLDLNCAGGQTAVSVAFTGGTGNLVMYASVYEFDNLLSSAAFDKTAGHVNSTSVSSWTSTSSPATTQADEIWAGAVMGYSTSADPVLAGPSSPWANLAELNSLQGTLHFGYMSGWETVSSTGTAEYAGTTSPNMSESVILAVTLKVSPPGVTAAPGSADGAGAALAASPAAGTLTAALYAGSASGVSGSWVNTSGAAGSTTGDYATWTDSGAGSSAVLEAGTFGAQAAVPAGSTVTSVTCVVRHGEAPSSAVASVTAQAYSGTTPVGSAQPLTAADAVHDDTVTFTGLAYADLADLRVRVTVTRN